MQIQMSLEPVWGEESALLLCPTARRDSRFCCPFKGDLALGCPADGDRCWCRRKCGQSLAVAAVTLRMVIVMLWFCLFFFYMFSVFFSHIFVALYSIALVTRFPTSFPWPFLRQRQNKFQSSKAQEVQGPCTTLALPGSQGQEQLFEIQCN